MSDGLDDFRRLRLRGRFRGFTLIELLVVIGITAVVAADASSGGYSVTFGTGSAEPELRHRAIFPG